MELTVKFHMFLWRRSVRLARIADQIEYALWMACLAA